MEASKFFIGVRKVTEKKLFNQLLPVVFLVFLFILFTAMTGGGFIFDRSGSLKIDTYLYEALVVGTVSIGASFIFATGNVNLAMGATTVLTATISALAYQATGSFTVLILVALVLGVGIMVISALLSTLLKIRVMYVTIVMMTLLVAIQESIIGGDSVSVSSVSNKLLATLEDYYVQYIMFVIFFIATIIIFHFTAVGRSLRLLGTNQLCAEQTGISKKKYMLIAFALAGVACAFGAVMLLIKAKSVSKNTMSSLNTDVMLALVLGGMSIFGGSRSYVYSGVVGAITVIVLNMGLTQLDVDSSIIQAVRGIIFLLLVFLSQKRPAGLPAPEG